jgi:hypothetical protein
MSVFLSKAIFDSSFSVTKPSEMALLTI